MEMFGKNVFNKDAGFIANAFGVVAAIWLIPVIICFVSLDTIFVQVPKQFMKYMKKKMK
tara:strand:- start:18 stop:194 length:177 start_codon:yes stop_codon:yes gene_type:complete